MSPVVILAFVQEVQYKPGKQMLPQTLRFYGIPMMLLEPSLVMKRMEQPVPWQTCVSILEPHRALNLSNSFLFLVILTQQGYCCLL